MKCDYCFWNLRRSNVQGEVRSCNLWPFVYYRTLHSLVHMIGLHTTTICESLTNRICRNDIRHCPGGWFVLGKWSLSSINFASPPMVCLWTLRSQNSCLVCNNMNNNRRLAILLIFSFSVVVVVVFVQWSLFVYNSNSHVICVCQLESTGCSWCV